MSRSRIGAVMGPLVWLGFVAESGFIAWLTAVGETRFASLSAAGLLLWAIGILLTRRHRYRAGLWLILAALLLHGVAGALIFGWAAGFQYYLLPMVLLMTFNERWRASTGLLGGLLVLGLCLLLYAVEPDKALGGVLLRVLTSCNLTVSLMMLTLIAFQFRIASMDVEQLVATLAVTDPLTGLANRRQIHQRLHEEESRSARTQSTFCVIMADIDHFKRVNDSFGHEIGDQVLMEVAKIFRAALRAQDVVARWGGEEFLLLLPHTTLDRARDVAERLRVLAEMGLASVTSGNRVTLTLGVAQYGSSIEQCLKVADEALYDGKQNGRNQVVVAGLAPPARLVH